MGKKRGKATAPPAATTSTALARAEAAPTQSTDVDELPDDRIDYTDQHGVHWVADGGAALPTVPFAPSAATLLLTTSPVAIRGQLGSVR
eukprot:COSAG02_NODE_210_length_28878_cov_133.787136_29_plen_89_part_00